MKFVINEENIPTLAVGFTRSLTPLGDAIAYARGGIDALKDPSFPSHALLFTRDQGRLFATEERYEGLVERSLGYYCKPSNRLVAVHYWRYWNPTTRDRALHELANIRADHELNSKYDYAALFHFLPVIGKWFKPSSQRQVCSENVASILKKYGAGFITETLIAPDQLLKIMRASPECDCVLGYYK